MKCDECEDSVAETHCEDCGQFLCAVCDASLHKKGKRKDHTRGPVCPSCQPESPCTKCVLATPVRKPTTTLYWEMSGMYPKSQEDAKRAIANISQVYGAIKEIRAYAQNFLKLGPELSDLGFELITREGVSDYQSLIMDISLKSRDEDPGTLLVLSASAGRLKSFLCELTQSLPKDCVLVTSALEPLNFLPPEQVQVASSYTITSRVKPTSQDFKAPRPRQEPKETMPLFQKWGKKLSSEGVEGKLLDFLKSYANQGKIMSEINTLVSGFQHYAIVKAEQARNALQAVQTAELAHITNRAFGTLKTVSFVSLKAESLSLELLLWTLRSLKNDEMLPTERAIQSRMKEAFDFKPTQTQWQQLLDAVAERSKHHHSFSAPDMQITKHAKAPVEVPVYSIPNFIVKDVQDPLTNLETKVVYPDDEEWIALDNHMKAGDVLQVKDSEYWHAFVSFLETYFSPEEVKRVWRKTEEDKAISGGRYGCAQFLKFCGPDILQGCSLGKLSYMVQLAINEDLLRYQKTLLVWTPGTHKRTDEEMVAEKLRLVQQAVVDTLRDSSEGVSLAQLPMQVRRMLTFPLDLGELGFAKLKDLLATIPMVKVELRGSNHPFAVLVPHSAKTSASDSDAQALLIAIKAIVSENRFATPAAKLESALVSRLGRVVNWKSFDCSGVGEFAQRWGGDSLEVLRTDETHVMMRADPWKQDQGHAYSYSASQDNLESQYYRQIPPQKVVMVSDLPAEFQMSRDWESEEQHRKYVEELLEDDIHARLQGEDPPHFRTDSVEFHSANPSYSQIDGFYHAQAMSQDFSQGQSKHTHLNRSYIDPPPGI